MYHEKIRVSDEKHDQIPISKLDSEESICKFLEFLYMHKENVTEVSYFIAK